MRELELLHHLGGEETHCRTHGGVLVRGEQTVTGLHTSDCHRPLSRLTGHKHRLLVRLLWHGNLLIRLHWRVLDHHALHLVAHIALLVASESEVGCWLHAHHSLVVGRWVWHHGLVHLLLGQVLALRAVIGQRVDGGPVVLLLLVGAVGVVGRRAVTRGHLLDRLLDVRVLLEELLVQSRSRESSRARCGAGVRVSGTRVLKWDRLTLEQPWVSS